MESDLEVYRRYAAEGVLLVGGAAAILLQLADPRVAAGVARHSDFASRALDRLVGTVEYLYAVGYGDERDIRHIVRLVNRAHAPVRGDAADGTTSYSAFDPDAQRWVASTITAVGLALDRRLHPRRDPGRDDAIVRGSASLSTTLQGARAGWPTTTPEFDRWFAERVDALRVGDEARAVARVLLSGAALPPLLRPLMPPLRLATAALLPPAVREAYGFRWTPRTARVAEAWLDATVALWRPLPRGIRHAPMRLVLRRVRRRASRYADADQRGRR